MKKLSGALGNTKENKKKASTLTENVEVEKTTSRKIFARDYELLRKYAFFTNQTVTSAIDSIFKDIDNEIAKKGIDILPNVPKEDIENDEQKNIRISLKVNNRLKEISKQSRIPAKYIFSLCLMYIKDSLEEEIKNNMEFK